MAGAVSKVGWKIIGGAAAAAGGTAATRSVNAVHKKVRGGEPPRLAHPDTSWREAMFWALLSAVAVAIGRLAAERAVAVGWARATGALPPGMEREPEPVAEPAG
ncbi:DUF4235 domain-containing protein [Frankia sp. CNm7]|uniref:DUF4235 domain-containing protein n=1 Tax=Frankia nepalensis TaxID=1836974 RepID=A0A937UQ98_9ACTN|nr:DUF4235 domain-containing protein [Frankia nepalensis]MBL7495171.1 DUF4235 domain-containing protein [Frankia nepalensis]MBL7514209.1 DUF4235 domain-containing protein [Frankia nepalensis]MBL7520013.1 DUF4235 domain-containing protein [Frankia nepalensis]MBL7629878.1 DUF4235 domain-containing protein [Frankia nepalensis]